MDGISEIEKECWGEVGKILVRGPRGFGLQAPCHLTSVTHLIDQSSDPQDLQKVYFAP